VPMDGLGLPAGGTGGLVPGAASAPARKPSPGRPAADRILPAQAEAAPLGQTGVPVRNLPVSTDMAGDTLSGGDSLARDGLAGNGLGVPMGDRLPVGTVQGLAAQGTSALGGGSGLGGLPLAGLPLGGLGASSDVSDDGEDGDRDSRSQGTPVVAGDAVHVLPPVGEFYTEAAGLPTDGLPAADDLPVFGSLLNGGTLPTRANLNTLPGAAPIPVHDLLAPGTSATGASTGAAYNTVNGAMSGGGTESLPLGAESLPLGDGALPLGGTDSLPVVGGLTGPNGTSGVPLDGIGGLPVLGGGGPLGGGFGGRHRADYEPRHSVDG